MLALTECRLGGAARISAAAVSEAVQDWPAFGPEEGRGWDWEGVVGEYFEPVEYLEDDEVEGVDWERFLGGNAVQAWEEAFGGPEDGVEVVNDEELELYRPSSVPAAAGMASSGGSAKDVGDGETGVLTLSGALQARSTLFRKPAFYFDPFASPIHFFRTPIAETPRDLPLPVEMDSEPLLSEDEGSVVPKEAPKKIPKRRKYSLRYPPTGTGLRLPYFDISVGEESLLYEQNLEMALYLRRSLVRTLTKTSEEDYIVDLDEENAGFRVDKNAVLEAEKMIRLRVVDGVGAARDESSEIERVGAWMRTMLRKP